MRNKHKFYQPTAKQQQQTKITNIYELMNQQERNMAQILEKYQKKPYLNTLQQNQRTTMNTNPKQHPLIKSRRSVSNNVPLLLPIIGKSSPEVKLKPKRYKNKLPIRYQNNPYFFQSINQQQKQRIKGSVQNAYSSDKPNKLRSRTKLQTENKKIKIPSRILQSKKSSAKLKSQIQSQQDSVMVVPRQQKSLPLPLPLGYFKAIDDEQEWSSSEEGEVPMSYYQKQYRRLIRQQCLQQTNFLYFSRSEGVNNWTDNLLLLFEKHDKQLNGLRRRCKYLKSFDKNYFSVDIFYD